MKRLESYKDVESNDWAKNITDFCEKYEQNFMVGIQSYKELTFF